MSIALGLAALVAAQSSPVEDRWLLASIGSNDAYWYVDRTSIKQIVDRLSGNARKAWLKVDYSRSASVKHRESKMLVLIKCDTEQSRFSSWIDYDAKGNVINSESNDYSTYAPIAPETVMASIMNVVCAS